MKHAIPEMRKNGGGSIISTASIAGLFGGYGSHAYSAAKAAVVNLTRSVALEAAKHRIRVNCICPGGGKQECVIIFMPVPKGGRNWLAQFLLANAPVLIEIQRKCNQHKEE
jgi:NAD(P)-dependent dehydrogenase (short-subunit alcohol dehydrogenase family)